MKSKSLDEKTKTALAKAQRNERTEHLIYGKLAQSTKGNNKKVLEHISNDELKHYHFWKEYTSKDVGPDLLKLWKYVLISKLFGLTFGLKLMENGEKGAEWTYSKFPKSLRIAKTVLSDENSHEKALVNMIDEEKMHYVGSIVLGLNDALVELTGALAGFTFALQNAKIIATAGLITGIAAALSMAASEYLSKKTEPGKENPLRASTYTGIAYIFTVMFLIMPFFLSPNVYLSLAWTVLNAVLVIFVFTFYISVAKGIPFKKRFSEMALVSLGVTAITFMIGWVVKTFLNIQV